MSQCPSCNNSNPEGLKYCAACGHELDQGLSGFLQANGLGEHLEVFRQNDLLNVSDLLGLEDGDLRELKLPYGDLVRLRTALQTFRAGHKEEEEVISVQPAPEPVVQQVAAVQPAPLVSAPQPAKSGAGKVVAWVVGGVVALVIIGAIGSGDPNNTSKEEELQEASRNLSNQAEQAAQEALERARQAEQELATMREKAAHAEKEKAQAQRIAAEQEAQRLRDAADEAERQKQQALERAAQAEMNAQQKANEAEQEMARLRNQAAQASTQQQPAPTLDGLDAFFQSYVNSLASDDQWQVANHYADSVEYGYAKSKSGRASRAEIAEDNRKLFASYPQRSYSNIHIKQVIPVTSSVARINYGFDYQYNGKKLAMGSTDVWATVENIGGRWQITSWREQVRRAR